MMELTAPATEEAASFTALTALLAMRRGALTRFAVLRLAVLRLARERFGELERLVERERLRVLAAFFAATLRPTLRLTVFARRFAPLTLAATLRRVLDLPVLRFPFPRDREADFFLGAITIHLL